VTTLSDKFAAAADNAAQGTGPNEDGLMFIGEGKKYANEEEADKAIAFKEDHISKIELENASLGEAMDKASTIDDVLTRIRDNKQLDNDTYSKTLNEDPQTTDIDALVAKALDEKLTFREQKMAAESNAQSVVSNLTERYGERAGELYAAKGKELGIDLDSLAATSPKAVLEFFKEPSRTVGSYMGGGQNTSNLNRGGQADHGTYDYWNKQMKSGKITRDKCFKEQHKSLQAMGASKFYSQNS